MKSAELQQRLEVLRAELNRTTGIDDESRRQLQALVADIEQDVAASDSGTATSSPTSLQERIAAAMTDFEVKHPQLATSLSQIVDQLAMMGI